MKSQGKYSSNDESIQKYLGLNLKMLRFIGLEFNLNDSKTVKKSLFMQSLPIFATNLMGVAVVMLQVSFIRDALRRDEKDLTTKIGSELFANILCISKGFRMAKAVETIQAVFNEISIIWIKYRPNQDRRNKISKKAYKTLTFCRCYLSIMISNIVAFALPPVQNIVFEYFIRETTNHTLAYSKRVFYLMYPFEITNIQTYLFVLFQEQYLLILSGMYWVSCDTLFAQLTTHTSMQLEILQHDIKTLVNSERAEDRLKENIIIFIKRHQGLLRLCKLIEDIFSPVILATVLLSALNICINMFETREMRSEGNHAGIAFYSIRVVILFFQIFFYCTFAETLTKQTSAIAEAVYNCNWTEKNYKLRFYLQMVIKKSQSPFYCTAYGFFPIGHKILASITNTSFSYLMMLQSLS